jgi:hypothetical protein
MLLLPASPVANKFHWTSGAISVLLPLPSRVLRLTSTPTPIFISTAQIGDRPARKAIDECVQELNQQEKELRQREEGAV